ncbi:cytidine deaminase [Rubrivirga sp. IMCC43871]|uniref:cytidine deaminase n=1 Tax=Rubrivirga sp. IMCC43871 TaxID=3391575 RepID=UPI003990066D
MPDRLRALATAISERSHAPYSGAPVGVAILLSDGRTVAAPRIENASFPLTISALQGALALAALARGTPVAVAQSTPFASHALGAIASAAPSDWRIVGPDLAVSGGTLPKLADAVDFELADAPDDLVRGAELALAISERAVVPASHFPVGAVVVDAHGRTVAGANVEIATDWAAGLCAERTALVAARAAGLGPIRTLYVACVKAPGGTPCGGCRQVIAELAPDAAVAIWRGPDPPHVTSPDVLLPGAFRGDALGR